jgi:hypothetical protein
MSKRIGKRWYGRVQLAITQDMDKAQEHFPWAKSFVQVKSGVWCFECRTDADIFRDSRTSDPIPGAGKAPE